MVFHSRELIKLQGIESQLSAAVYTLNVFRPSASLSRDDDTAFSLIDIFLK